MPDELSCRICGAPHPLSIFEENGKLVAECHFHFFECDESSWNQTLKDLLGGAA